jgi:asparagine synthase (glutamine-hydrolysing)
MCGIAGIVRVDGRPVLESEVRAMCGAMTHRGPDEEGIYLGEGVGLGTRRLSIIDLENGQQPVSNEDGSVWVVFDGEIYNYRELRALLTRRGHVFRTASDTETIVHLYEDFGPKAVGYLSGMFAFAVWDERRRQLLLARDRLGIRPLYYAQVNGDILFASELKPILQLPEVGRQLSWEGVSHLFTFLATSPSHSIVDGIRKLEPARIAVASSGGSLRIERYWDLAFEPDEGATEQELVERLRLLLMTAVARHQISDVPVGAFLSGRLDSSAVVAAMARLSPDRVKTFSIGFVEHGYDELLHARRVATSFHTDHHELILKPDAVALIEDLAWYLDEPIGDASAIPTYIVARLAAEHVKVVLTGDGGDELFGSYDKYVVEQWERTDDRVPAAIRRMMAAAGRLVPDGTPGKRFLQHLARRHLHTSRLFHADQISRLFRGEALEQLSAREPWAESPSDINNYLPLDVLTKVDRMTMAHSIEARPPLLDHHIVEFAAKVPTRLRLRGGTTKYLFKQAMRGILPDEIIDRPKDGLAAPLDSWFRGELSGFARDLLLSDRCRRRGLFNERYLEQLLRLNERGRDVGLQLWTIASFELWCRRFLDSSFHGDRPGRAARRERPPIVRRAMLAS